MTLDLSSFLSGNTASKPPPVRKVKEVDEPARPGGALIHDLESSTPAAKPTKPRYVPCDGGAGSAGVLLTMLLCVDACLPSLAFVRPPSPAATPAPLRPCPHLLCYRAGLVLVVPRHLCLRRRHHRPSLREEAATTTTMTTTVVVFGDSVEPRAAGVAAASWTSGRVCSAGVSVMMCLATDRQMYMRFLTSPRGRA